MPNYAALKAALTGQYAGETDAVTIASVNAATINIPQIVTTQALASYLGTRGLLAALVKFANTPPTGTSAAATVAAQELALAFQSPALIPYFDMTDATVAASMQASLAALVSPGTGVTPPISAQNQSDILALASGATSQAAQWNFSPGITAGDLQTARAQP